MRRFIGVCILDRRVNSLLCRLAGHSQRHEDNPHVKTRNHYHLHVNRHSFIEMLCHNILKNSTNMVNGFGPVWRNVRLAQARVSDLFLYRKRENNNKCLLGFTRRRTSVRTYVRLVAKKYLSFLLIIFLSRRTIALLVGAASKRELLLLD